MRHGKQLLLDSRQFAHERRLTSWWCLLSTLAVFAGLQAVIVLAVSTPLRLAASIVAGLTMIRLFVIYHDYQHGTILRRSWAAWAIMTAWGMVTLNAPSIWRRSHDHHHKHNSKMYGASIGSFPLMTSDQYLAATPRQRRLYRATRHPLIFLFGYVTIFLYGMSVRSLMSNPRQHWDSGVALAVHAALVVLLAVVGVDLLLLCLLLPTALASMVGGYLFYAQHNFPGAHIQPHKEWDYVTAALRSSSYMKMSRLMAWFTGNIGYHHVHHLNHHIPFYRLPEALKAMPELNVAGVTTLLPVDVLRCLRLKVWDEHAQRLMPCPRSLPAAQGQPAAAEPLRGIGSALSRE